MFIETLEFTIPVDLCDVFSTMKKGQQSNVEFPASVNSYGTTQDANVQVYLRSNKLTFKVDGVSSDSSIISKSECKTLKLSVFDVDKSLMPFDNNEIEYDSHNTYTPQQSTPVPSLKRVHEQSVSIPSAKNSRSSFNDSPRPRSPLQRRTQRLRSSPQRTSSPPSKMRNDTSVNIKSEPDDPDLIEIELDNEEMILKDEIPYMQVDYSATGPDTSQTLSYPRVSHTQSSSSFHENVPHVPDYTEPGPSHHGDQSAEDYLVYQGDENEDNEANYSNDDSARDSKILTKHCAAIKDVQDIERNMPLFPVGYMAYKTLKQATNLTCEICGKMFTSSGTKKDHMAGIHGNVTYTCPCGRSYRYPCSFRRHRQTCPLAVGVKPLQKYPQ